MPRGSVDGMRTAISSHPVPVTRCPGCCSPAGPAEPYCRCCGIWLAGPQVAEVRWIDGELRRVDAARTQLISRRAAVLDELLLLRRQAAAGGPVPAAGGEGGERQVGRAGGPGRGGAGPADSGIGLVRGERRRAGRTGEPASESAASPTRRPEVSART